MSKAANDSKKGMSVRHEQWVQKLFGNKARRSRSSGASPTDKGDVRNDLFLIECKMTEGRIPTMVRQFEKIAEEAYEDGLTPLLFLRYYYPDSKLASKDGWVDLTVSLSTDFVELYQGQDWT